MTAKTRAELAALIPECADADTIVGILTAAMGYEPALEPPQYAEGQHAIITRSDGSTWCIDTRLAQIDPSWPDRTPLDHGLLNTPVSTRVPSPDRIHELATLYARRETLQRQLGME